MNSRDRYKNALKHLSDALVKAGPDKNSPHPKQLLDDIHRYSGELRRKVANLEGQVAQDRRLLERFTPLPSKVEQLESAKSELDNTKKSLAAKCDALQRRLADLEPIAVDAQQYSDVEVHTQVKAKCLQCGLHFTLFTDSPEQHTSRTLHCPECGQSDGEFIVWHEPGKGFIFQNVPGRAQLVEFSQRPPSCV